MTHNRLLSLFSAALLTALSACDRPGALTSVTDPATAPPAGAVALTCTATVRTGSIECRPARGSGVRADLLLGGQGVRVKLVSSNVVYDGGTETLRTDVTVQNLLSQAIGTPDGTTVEGVRVFFHALPTVTDGSGTVTVQNPDGVGTFTAANQPFFLYDQILTPRGTSAAKTWRFTVPATAVTFVFSVYVAAAAPVESGVLRWEWERGTPALPYLFSGVWGASDSSVFVTAHNGFNASSVAHWNGHGWTELLSIRTDDIFDTDFDLFSGVSGTGPRDVRVATGSLGVRHYDGNTWTRYPITGQRVRAVWAAAPGAAFAAGDGNTIWRWNGSAWVAMTVPQYSPTYHPRLNGVWGSSPANVFAVGDSGVVLHFNGSAWTRMESGTRTFLRSVWGSSPTDVWVVGDDGNALHYDGTAWQSMETPALSLGGVWGSSATEVYAVGADSLRAPVLLRWNGSTWAREPVNVPALFLTAVWGTPDGHFVAVGAERAVLRKEPAGSWTADPQGQMLYDVEAAAANDVYAAGLEVLHWDGNGWSTTIAFANSRHYTGAAHDGAGTWYFVGSRFGTDGILSRVVNGTADAAPAGIAAKPLNGVWAAGPGDVFAVGQNGTIVRGSGLTFSAVPSGTTQHLMDVWGSSAGNVFAVGYGGTIRRFNGTSWSAMASGTTMSLVAVHGTGPSDVWAVGSGGTVLHYDGSAWTPVPSGTTAALTAVWAAPGGMVYAGGDGVLLRYANGAWASYGSGFSHLIEGLGGSSATNVYAVGSGGLILHGLH